MQKFVLHFIEIIPGIFVEYFFTSKDCEFLQSATKNISLKTNERRNRSLKTKEKTNEQKKKKKFANVRKYRGMKIEWKRRNRNLKKKEKKEKKNLQTKVKKETKKCQINRSKGYFGLNNSQWHPFRRGASLNWERS